MDSERWDESTTPEQREAAVKLAQSMARAAGKTQPVVMVMACSMLLELSYMARFPDAYIDWKIARELAEGVRNGQ